MDNTVKRTVAIIAIAIVVGIAVYGSFLPVRKTQMYIFALQDLQSRPVGSLQELKDRLSPGLTYPSPIGQEELVRNMANSVLAFVQRGGDATSTAQLITILRGYYDPILNRGMGMSFGQDVYLMGAINEMAFAKTGDPIYLAEAKRNYLLARALGPNRPQSLFGLFDVYRASGDVTDAKEVANVILANWPTEDNIRSALAQFLAAQATSTKGSPAKAKN